MLAFDNSIFVFKLLSVYFWMQVTLSCTKCQFPVAIFKSMGQSHDNVVVICKHLFWSTLGRVFFDALSYILSLGRSN